MVIDAPLLIYWEKSRSEVAYLVVAYPFQATTVLNFIRHGSDLAEQSLSATFADFAGMESHHRRTIHSFPPRIQDLWYNNDPPLEYDKPLLLKTILTGPQRLAEFEALRQSLPDGIDEDCDQLAENIAVALEPIFIACHEGMNNKVATVYCNSLNSKDPPWPLSQVCHRWRSVALNIARIWSSIKMILHQELMSEEEEELFYAAGKIPKGSLSALNHLFLSDIIDPEGAPPDLEIDAFKAAPWVEHIKIPWSQLTGYTSHLAFDHVDRVGIRKACSAKTIFLHCMPPTGQTPMEVDFDHIRKLQLYEKPDSKGGIKEQIPYIYAATLETLGLRYTDVVPQFPSDFYMDMQSLKIDLIYHSLLPSLEHLDLTGSTFAFQGYQVVFFRTVKLRRNPVRIQMLGPASRLQHLDLCSDWASSIHAHLEVGTAWKELLDGGLEVQS
ncbi:hypothetical protein DFS33DRAFT_1276606 [Desarmillaria ectypa]|nr:hypothetical protein DFS33DRAFT_1276606 [Desarmillaria ectypa]